MCNGKGTKWINHGGAYQVTDCDCPTCTEYLKTARDGVEILEEKIQLMLAQAKKKVISS